METFGNKKVAKSSKFFFCEECDYKTSHRHNFKKHLLTAKHRKMTKWKHLETFGNEKVANGNIWKHLETFGNNLETPENNVILHHSKDSNMYICKYCEKKFRTRSGIWKHNSKCFKNPEIMEKKMEKKMMEKILKAHQEAFAKKLAALETKNISNINTQNNNIKQNNNININLYLNKHCKNAQPLLDFVRDLQFTLSDINPERPSSTIESLSNVIVNKLEDMSETERPLHCSDAKRLNFYVKDASGWTKDEDNKKIDKAIGFANMRHQGAWYDQVKEEGLDKTDKDIGFHTMNVAMAKFSDDPQKAKRKIKRAIACVTNLKKAKDLHP